ncbi:MAG: prolyl oligopeptidase family serine peptidase, partial [Actinomycetota bacterium]|nr:prolyl oligopeptidase family serine peptidase [Actinomycetota bacterium]
MGLSAVTAAMCARGRVLADPRLSPDGTVIVFLAVAAGRGALMAVGVDGGPEVIVTTNPPPAPTGGDGGGIFDWMPSGKALVYAGADGLLYYQPLDGGPATAIVTDGPVSAPAVAPDGTRVAYVRAGRDVAVAGLAPGGPWPIRISGRSDGVGGFRNGPDFAFDPTWSPDSATVAWHEWDVPAMPWDDSRIVFAHADGRGEPTAVATGGPAEVSQPRFAPSGEMLSFLCDTGGWLNLWRSSPDAPGAKPLLPEQAEHGGPPWGPGERTYAWSPDGDRLVFCRNEAGFGRLCLLDLGTGQVSELDRGCYTGLSWAGRYIAGIRSGARTPNQIVVLDPCDPLDPVDPADPADPADPVKPSNRPARRSVARGPVGGFEAAGLVEPETVTWEGEPVAGSGTTVHGHLYRTSSPEPGADRPPPLLVWAHGGPTAQSRVVFNPRVAYFCHRGFNVLQVDYRGSTGWGRRYTQALRGEWG